MHSDSGETRSIWMETAVPDFAALPADAHADVCVVGAGIAGLATAYCLARAGRSVLVLEDGSIGGGETGRTTAHLSDALDDGYVEIERVHGREGARLAAQSHRAAIDRIESIARDENIACGFTRLDGYLFRGRNDKSGVLESELEAAQRAGLEGVALVPSPLPSMDRGSCLRFPRQGQFHPLEYLSGLARALVSAGGQIFTHTRVRAVEDGAPCRVATSRGHTLTCGELVVATNSPISDRLAMHTKQAAYRTYAIALQIEPTRVPRGLYWDTEDPYHYVRTYEAASDQLSSSLEAKITRPGKPRMPASASRVSRPGRARDSPDAVPFGIAGPVRCRNPSITSLSSVAIRARSTCTSSPGIPDTA